MSHASELIESDILAYLDQHENKDLLRFLTCGSVDDGKSTLIGRLLFDSKLIFEDHLASLHKDSERMGNAGEALDLALLVDGLASEREQGIRLGLFELAWVGVPLLLVGGAFLVLFSSRLLPDRGGLTEELDLVREYGVEVEVLPGPLNGKTIAEAGLRALNYGYLTEIDRGGRLITAVEPDRTLQTGDKLYFVGAPECASELRRIHGLKPANGSVHKLEVANHQRCLVEVVLGQEFSALGTTVRDSRFRTRFIMAVIVHNAKNQGVTGQWHH